MTEGAEPAAAMIAAKASWMRPTAREAPESNAARTTTTGPHHESRATGSQTQDGKRSGTVRQECRDAIASPPKGPIAGNMTGVESTEGHRESKARGVGLALEGSGHVRRQDVSIAHRDTLLADQRVSRRH